MNRAEPLTPWPIRKPTMPAGKKAGELYAAWVHKHAQIEAVEEQYHAAQLALREADTALQSALIDASQSGKQGKAVADAESAYTAARTEAEAPWRHRLQAPIAAAEAARHALGDHVSENLEELLGEPELAAEAEAAREEVLATTKAHVDAAARWRRSRDAHRAVIRCAEDIDGRAIPDLDGAVRESASAAERVLERPQRVPTPAPATAALRQRAVARGEAREVPVEVDGRTGFRFEPVT